MMGKERVVQKWCLETAKLDKLYLDSQFTIRSLK